MSEIKNYEKAGYHLFPLSGKTPVVKEWQKTKHLQHQVRSVNFGLALQADDLIIDVDPKNFRAGDKPHQRLTKLFPEIKHSLIVQTGSGGLHIYLKKPVEFKTRKHHQDYPGIDFLSQGSFAVGAGSKHPTTKKEYKIVRGGYKTIVSTPTALLELLKSNVEFENDEIDCVDDAATVNRFKEWLKTAPVAVDGQNGNDVTFKVACKGRAFGLSHAFTTMTMWKHWNDRCEPPWGGEDLEHICDNAYKYNEEPVGKHHPHSDFDAVTSEPLEPSECKEKQFSWHRTKVTKSGGGDLKVNSIHNVCNFFKGYKHTIELEEILRFNLLSFNIEFARRPFWMSEHEILSPWDDNDALAVTKLLSTRLAFNVSKNLVHDAALAVAQENKYHPIIDYLESLDWDGTRRVGNWLPVYLKTKDTVYERAVGQLMLVAAIKRIYQAGCKFKNIVVLEGDQGIGKSPVCEILGGEWYADMTLNVNSPDTVDAMRNKWIIEVSEMECTRRAETQALKSFISRQVDVVRLAYARSAKEFPRHNIFVGTFNPDNTGGYLKDMSGNTRYLPVLVPEGKMIDVKGLTNDRDQLWAEALLIYKKNVRVELYIKDKIVNKIAEKETLKRRAKDPWLGKVSDWLDNPTGIANEKVSPRFFAKADEIYTHAIGGEIKDLSRDKFIRIANVMQDLGWGKSRIGTLGEKNYKRSVRGYFRPEEEMIDLL